MKLETPSAPTMQRMQTSVVPNPQSASDLLPDSQLAFAQSVHEEFLRSLSASISAYLEFPVTLAAREDRQTQFGAFLESEGPHIHFLSLRARQTGAKVLAGLPNELLHEALRILLALPEGTSIEKRTVTEIELHVLGDFLRMVSDALAKAWRHHGVETDPDSDSALAPEALRLQPESRVIVLGSEVRCGAAKTALYQIVPPFLIRSAAAAAKTAVPDAGISKGEILQDLARACVRVEAILEGAPIRIKDLLTLGENQVLTTNRPLGTPFTVLLNGKAKLTGELTCIGQRQTLQIGAVIPVASEDSGVPR